MRNKKVLVIIVGIIVSLIIILGSSYAYLRVEKKSGNQNISIANFGLVIKEDMEAITLDNEVPKSDEEGLKNSPNTFTIENQGNITAKYRVSLIDSTVASTMSNLDVRYQVKRIRSTGSETLEIKNLSADGLFDEGIIAPNEEISFELILWIDYKANPNGLKYSKVLSLEGLQADTQDTSGANPPEMLSNMIPVYYDKISDTEGVWKVADVTNQDASHKWYDYNNFMWANAVTVKDDKKIMSDITGNSIMKDNPYFTVLENGNLYFDGVDDYLTLGHENHDFKNNISIVVKFKIDNFPTTDNSTIIGNQEMAGFYISINSDKQIIFSIHTGSDYNYVFSSTTIDIGKWYTVVATYDGSKMQLYIYNEEGKLQKEEKDVTGNIKTSVAQLMLGANPWGGNSPPSGEYLNGTINLALVYTDTLTDEEITNNFVGQITTYPRDNLLVEAKELLETSGLLSKYTSNDDGSVTFDGKDDFYYLGQENYNFKNSISVVIRVKIDSIPSNNGFIIGNAENAGFYFHFSPNKKLLIRIHDGSDYKGLDSSKTLEEGIWYTIVATYDGSKMIMYIYQDGKLLSKDESDLTINITPTPTPLMLGANPSINGLPNREFLNCSISSAFVYTDALTDTEIEEYFKGEITNYPKDNLLLGYDNFKEKSAREVYLNAKPGTEIKMEDISSMWVWIPRYKYTIFNGNNETVEEQMINVEFERGINSTGTVSCKDKILTDDDSASSEECTDKTNGGIKNVISLNNNSKKTSFFNFTRQN